MELDGFSMEAFRGRELPALQGIIEGWPRGQTDPLVSIVCITFNQAAYIEDALRGFLSQKTNFAFEIIIHDDASTDGTGDIISKYAALYPGLIVPVLQTVNQFSQAKKIFPMAAAHAKGNLVALCEGDDFWISEEKLQKQVNALLQHPDINICFHRAFSGSADQEIAKAVVSNQDMGGKASIVSVETVVRKGGAFMPTASIMMRRSVFPRLPDWFSLCPVEDYYLQVISSFPKGAVFLPDVMAFYRVSAAGSWTSRVFSFFDKFYIDQDRSLNNLGAWLGDDLVPVVSAERAMLALHAAFVAFRKSDFEATRLYLAAAREHGARLDFLFFFIYLVTRNGFAFRWISRLYGRLWPLAG